MPHPPKRKRNPTTTKTLTRGPNKGDRVKFATARHGAGKKYPLKIVKDTGKRNTSKIARRQRAAKRR